VTEAGLEPIRKRCSSNWITETNRRSPRAAVAATESAFRFPLARRASHRNKTLTPPTTGANSCESGRTRTNLGAAAVSIFFNLVCSTFVCANFANAVLSI
jgi:hypothetical protein